MARSCRTISSPSELSPYHRRVCELLAQGYNQKEIAEVLRSNPNAIHSVVARMLKATGTRNQIQLLCFFLNHPVPIRTHTPSELVIHLTA